MDADILLVTTWDTACGIAEHSAMLIDAVHTQSTLRVLPLAAALSPPSVDWDTFPKVVHLNYHAALHSQWTPERVQQLKRMGRKVIVTYHDTGVPNSDQCKALYAVADAFIVHEPAEDLSSAYYWRMGVCDAVEPLQFGVRDQIDSRFDGQACFKAYDAQPVLGSLGFPFPWKCFDQLAQITRDLGWALVLIAPNATESQVATWRMTNPNSWIITEFLRRSNAQSILAGCDATAFTYVTHNTGQSGAILQGIATRKPVIALSTCRQFRALYTDNLGYQSIRWCETFEDVRVTLRNLPIQRVDPRTVALAEQDSWRSVGQKYIQLYEGMLGR